MSKSTFLNALREFDFPTNTSRKNIFNRGQTSYKGFVLGKINNTPYWVNKGLPKQDLSRFTKQDKYKPIYKMARDLMKKHNPSFKFSSIQFNKNQRSARHKDGRNATDSYIIGLGDYIGGNLRIWSEDEKKYKDVNIRNRWVRFNGAKHFHETTPFKGERYTIVYYNI